MMREYRSVTYATSNENKLREVVLEHYRKWWQTLLFLPAKKEVWVGGTVWYDKFTGERASREKCAEIDEAVTWIKITTQDL